MFMFRKREVVVSTSAGLKDEAKKFQDAVADVNSRFKPNEINMAAIEAAAAKFETDVATVAGAFEVYLKNNAIEEIRKIKDVGDYTFLNLEEVAASYGFDLDTLGVSYYTE